MHLHTLGTRGFFHVRREFSVLAEGQRILPILAEAGNRARKVFGNQGNIYKALNSPSHSRSSTLATRFQEMLRDYTIAFR